jgi:hypothetical protein
MVRQPHIGLALVKILAFCLSHNALRGADGILNSAGFIAGGYKGIVNLMLKYTPDKKLGATAKEKPGQLTTRKSD